MNFKNINHILFMRIASVDTSKANKSLSIKEIILRQEKWIQETHSKYSSWASDHF